MQANLVRGDALGVRDIRRLGLLAAVPLSAALAFLVPGPALAACGASHPAGVHSGAGTGAHAPTSVVKTGAGGGGSGTLGCANGASVPAPHGLAMAGSGKVVEGGAHQAAHAKTHARTAATKPANVAAHPHGAKPPHA